MSERSIFLAALDRESPPERTAYLDEACSGDPALRQQVEALLQSHEGAGSFLGTPAAEQVATNDEESDAPTIYIDRSQGTGGASASGSSETPLSFLTPSEEPGRLGRLTHYEIMSIIGQGGMGVVLKAFDTSLHRVVAIKVMAPQLATTASARARFIREAKAAAAVVHEHVVTIHAVDKTSPLPYIVMQCVEGASLEDKLKRVGQLGVKEILRIGMQAAAGLAAAHKQGLIHRDIKPANILLENGVERVKITDFGLARAADEASMTQSGLIAGTPQYMSPEQAEGKPVDQRSDLFSLGSVLYALCTGRPAFRANSTIAVLKRVCEDTPRPIREINPEIPEWLCDIISKLHAKNPDDRFQTAKEVAELLEQHLSHIQQPALAPLPPRVELPRPSTATLASLERLFEGTDFRQRIVQNYTLLTGIALVWLSLAMFASPQVMLFTSFVTFACGAASITVAIVTRQRFTTNYRGHDIRVENGVIAGEKLYLDGKLMARGGLGRRKELRAPLPGEKFAGDEIVVLSEAGLLRFRCRIFVEHGCIRPGLMALGTIDGYVAMLLGTALLVAALSVPVLGTWWNRQRIAALFFERPTPAQRSNAGKVEQPRIDPPAEAWTPLFNGKNFDGWVAQTRVEGQDPKSPWRIADGVLWAVGGAWASNGTGGRGTLRTEKQYENYSLRLKFRFPRRAPGDQQYMGETGVVVHRQEAEPVTPPTGIGLNLGRAWEGRSLPVSVVPARSAKKADAQAMVLKAAGEWNEMLVTCQDGAVEAWVNGKPAAKLTECTPAKGFIVLDANGTPMDFRDIEIKVLTVSKPPPAVAPFDSAKAKELQDAWAKHLGVEPEVTNSIGMKLRLIPPGEFQMGTPSEEIEHLLVDAQEWEKKSLQSESPPRKAWIRAAFFLGKYEVTIGQFKQFVADTGYKTTAQTNGIGGTRYVDSMQTDREFTWQFPADAISDEHPVVQIGLDDAKAFCAWLSQQDGRNYVVPDEEAWEHACRAGTTTRWYCGDGEGAVREIGWIVPEAAGRTQPVGEKQANAFGLCDMLGNVEELCLSREAVVSRGGHADHVATRTRSASRNAHGSHQLWHRRGFRVAAVGDLKAKPRATTEVLKDAVLLLNFNQETIYEKDGKTWVRDLSGQGNDAICEGVRPIETGRVGAGLANDGKSYLRVPKSLLARRGAITCAGWFKIDDLSAGQAFFSTRHPDYPKSDQPCVAVYTVPGGYVHANVWNQDWLNVSTREGVFKPGEWVFVAYSLEGSGPKNGKLHLMVNDQFFHFSSQSVGGNVAHEIIANDLRGTLDEIALWQRTLSDDELRQVYALGLSGRSLASLSAPPPAESVASDSAKPIDFNGTWKSEWGDVTFTHAPVTGNKPFDLQGTYYKESGIIRGTVDPKTRTFMGTFKETNSGGKLRLVLWADNNKITGHYGFKSATQDDPLDTYIWDMTRKAPADTADAND